MKTSPLLPLLLVIVSCAQAGAQQQRRFDEPLPPKTELEALQLETNAVIVRGSQRVGGVRAPGQGRVDVAAFEVINTVGGRRARGVAVEVEEVGERGREVTAFVDYEELEGLIKGLESVGRSTAPRRSSPASRSATARRATCSSPCSAPAAVSPGASSRPGSSRRRGSRFPSTSWLTCAR